MDDAPQVFHSGRPLTRILAYGDSLTAGYYDRGRRFAPYGQVALQHLSQHFPMEFWVCGLSSLTAQTLARKFDSSVIRDGVGRKGMGLQAILDSHGSFDLVLIMLGTNDVADFDTDLPSVVSQRIFEDIKRLHVLCHQRGIPTVALSVPENKFLHLKPPEEDYLECWHTVNKLLAEWSSSEEASGHVLRFIDTSKILPWSKQPDCIHLWEKDGLHFAPPGSEHLGVEIAAKLSDLLCSENYMKGANAAASDQGCGEAHDKDDKKVGEDVSLASEEAM